MTDQLTLDRLFERGRRVGAGRRIACFAARGKVSEQNYEEFAQDVIALASILRARGLKPGQRVATLAANSIVHLQLIWAIILAGGVYHGINTRLSADEIAYIVQDAEDRIIFIDPDLDIMCEKIRKTCFDRDTIVLGDNAEADDVSLDALLRSVKPVPEAIGHVVTDENAPAILCYTSGTTGRPKGVSYSHRALTLHALSEAMVDGYGIGNSDHVLLLVPFCHGAGWGVPCSAFMCGADISIFSAPMSPDPVLGILQDEQISFTAAVPEVIARIAREIAVRKVSLNGLRILMGGTAPRTETLEQLRSAGVTSMLCWGMTETLSAATMQHLPPEIGAVPLSQGQPLPLTELSLSKGPEGAQELLVRGPCVVEAYHGQDSSARENGWFATGDTAKIDADGTLRLDGRKRDLIKSGGEWISPARLEEVILQIAGVRECAVIGVPHPKWGERPLCILAASEPVNFGQIVDELMSTGRFAKWQIVNDVVNLKELPHTAVGKLDRQALRLRFYNHFQANLK